MAERCDRVMARIGEVMSILERGRVRFESLLIRLYGTEWWSRVRECRREVPIIFTNLLLKLYRDLERGILRVEDGKICSRLTCVPRRDLILAIDDYYDAVSALRKLWKELETCEL